MSAMEPSRAMSSGYESPMVKQELAKLDKGGDKRRSALVSLRACVEKLDANTMPRFLAQLSDTPNRSADFNDSRSYAISLYQDVARVHGKLIAPHIPRIMTTVIRSLSSSGSSVHLHDACSKVVASILRYSVSAGSDSSENIFGELCNPLLDALNAKLEPLAAGSALCLQALVESEKWRYAPRDLVAEICSRCLAALKDRSGQTAAHLHLARSVVKSPDSALPIQDTECGLGFLRAAKEILRTSSSWQHRAAALQLVRALMQSLDRDALLSESDSIAQIMEQIRLDRMPHVRNEAVKALQTLKTIVSEDARSSKGEFLREELDASSTNFSQESQVISSSPPRSSRASTPDSSPSSARRRVRRSRYAAVRSSCSSSDASDFFNVESKANLETDDKLGYQSFIKLDVDHDQEDQCVVTDDLTRNVSADVAYEVASCNTALLPCKSMDALSIKADADHNQEDQCVVTDDLMRNSSANVADEVASCNTPLLRCKSMDALLTAEDFIKFTTPRRLVRSLQTLASSPEVDTPGEVATKKERFESQVEVSAETEWSVRDNPIADQDMFSTTKLDERRDLDQTKTIPLKEVELTKVPGLKYGKIWSRMRRFFEVVLGGCLCCVMLLPLAMAVVRISSNTPQVSEIREFLVPT